LKALTQKASVLASYKKSTQTSKKFWAFRCLAGVVSDCLPAMKLREKKRKLRATDNTIDKLWLHNVHNLFQLGFR
jgi:hypothetical protein